MIIERVAKDPDVYDIKLDEKELNLIRYYLQQLRHLSGPDEQLNKLVNDMYEHVH